MRVLHEYVVVAPDGTVIRHQSWRTFYFVALVKIRNHPWAWARWSATWEGAERSAKEWGRSNLPDLEATWVGQCREV